jgi:hypothetical protein
MSNTDLNIDKATKLGIQVYCGVIDKFFQDHTLAPNKTRFIEKGNELFQGHPSDITAPTIAEARDLFIELTDNLFRHKEEDINALYSLMALDLVEIDNPYAIEVLVRALENDRPIIRNIALDNLSFFKNPPAILFEKALTLLETDEDENVREKAVSVLWHAQNKPGVVAAIDKAALQDPSQQVQNEAIDWLEQNAAQSATSVDLATTVNPNEIER